MEKERYRSNSYLRQLPVHYKHGDRHLNGCLLCEEKSKQNKKKDENGSNIKLEEKKSSLLVSKAETQSNVPNASSIIDTSEF